MHASIHLSFKLTYNQNFIYNTHLLLNIIYSINKIEQTSFQVTKYKTIKILWILGISCPKLEPPDHGVRFTCTNEWYFGSVCSLECESGYWAVDGSHIMCHFSKTWTRSDFDCKGLPNFPFLSILSPFCVSHAYFLLNALYFGAFSVYRMMSLVYHSHYMSLIV